NVRELLFGSGRHSGEVLLLFAETPQHCSAVCGMKQMIQSRLTIWMFAGFDEKVGDLACVVIIPAVSRSAVSVGCGISGESFVPVSLETLARGFAHALIAFLALGVLSKMFLVLALGYGDLLAIPVGVMDAILPVFFSNFFLVPVINVVVGAFADYYAAALASRVINETDLIYLQPGEDFRPRFVGHATSLRLVSPSRVAISRPSDADICAQNCENVRR